jgi:hypothetical protein
MANKQVETTAMGWRQARRYAPTNFREGTLNRLVLNYIRQHPGQDTNEIVAGLADQTRGNVASCISRFTQAGIIAKKR